MSKVCVTNVIKVRVKELPVTDNFVLRGVGEEEAGQEGG